MAAAWAVMQTLGVSGYVDLTRATLDTADRIRAAIAATDGVRVLGEGNAHLIAMASDPDAAEPVDVFALGDELQARRWYLDRQSPPDSLHATVSYGNAAVVDEYLADLAESIDAVRGRRTDDRSTNYATLE